MPTDYEDTPDNLIVALCSGDYKQARGMMSRYADEDNYHIVDPTAEPGEECFCCIGVHAMLTGRHFRHNSDSLVEPPSDHWLHDPVRGYTAENGQWSARLIDLLVRANDDDGGWGYSKVIERLCRYAGGYEFVVDDRA